MKKPKESNARIGNIEFLGGIVFLFILAYLAINPFEFISFRTFRPENYSIYLFCIVACNIIGVVFNLRHANDPFTIIGRLFNYITASVSISVFILTMPMLYAVSPTLVYSIFLSAMLSIVSLRVPDHSWLEVALASLAFLPILARYGLGWLKPQSDVGSYWQYVEIGFGVVLPICVFVLNSMSEKFVGTGSRAKWIWLYSFNSVYAAILVLIFYRGYDIRLIQKIKNNGFNKSDVADVSAMSVNSASEITCDITEENTFNDKKDIYGAGILGVVGGLLMIINSDSFILPFGLLLTSAGLWTLFANEVSLDERGEVGLYCVYFGVLCVGVFFLMMPYWWFLGFIISWFVYYFIKGCFEE